MKKIQALTVLVAVICLAAHTQAIAQPNDVEGWGKTKWGMTDKEIQSALGDQVKPYTEKGKFERAHIDLWIPNLEIGTDQYEVLFVMDNATDKLIQVGITPNPNSDPCVLFKPLEEMLVQKYGSPTHQNNQVGDFTTYKRIWNFPSTSIQLIYADCQGSSPLLQLTYRSNKK